DGNHTKRSGRRRERTCRTEMRTAQEECKERREAPRFRGAPPLLRQRKPYLTGSPPSRRVRRYRQGVACAEYTPASERRNSRSFLPFRGVLNCSFGVTYLLCQQKHCTKRSGTTTWCIRNRANLRSFTSTGT